MEKHVLRLTESYPVSAAVTSQKALSPVSDFAYPPILLQSRHEIPRTILVLD